MSKKRYIFKLELAGEGNNLDEAWKDAIEAFIQDPGDYHEAKEDKKYIIW